MLSTLSIEETDLQKLKRIARNKGKQVKEVIHDWIESQEDTLEKELASKKGLSKWAKVAGEAANLGISHETGQHILNTIKEFRKDEGV